MAKTVGPLLSLDAHGSIADILTYSRRRTGKQVRRYNKPLKDPTPAQRAQRRLTQFLVAHWQNMPPATKATWATAAAASGLNLSGYHYFLRQAQRDLYANHGLCAYWSFNRIVSGQVLDLSNLANHGTLQPDYPTNAPTLVDSRTAKFSKALYFDGTGPYVSLTASRKCLHGDFTILFWFNLPALDFRIIFSIAETAVGNKNEIHLFPSGTGIIEAYVYDKDGTLTILKTDAGLVVTNKWYMYALTHNNTTLANRIYLNGVVQADTDPSIAARDDDSQIWTIGALSDGSAPIYGTQDEFCIYNRVLSGAEKLTRYNFARRR